jgi:uncharacterized phage protein (TIGR02218 family)
MRDWTTEFKSYLADDNEIALCLKLTLSSNTIIRLTDRDTNITVGADTYISDQGFFTSVFDSSIKNSADTYELNLPYYEDGIVKTDLLAEEMKGASFELYLCPVSDLSLGLALLFSGTIGQHTIKDQDFDLELRSLSHKFQNNVGEVYSPLCRVKRFGYGQCGVGLIVADYTESGTVASVLSNKKFTCTDIVSPARVLVDDWYSSGEVIWTSGDNNGLIHRVRFHTYDAGTHTIELEYPSNYVFAVGDTFDIVAGCNRTRERCFVFNNVINMQAEPDMPGSKWAVIPDAKAMLGK